MFTIYALVDPETHLVRYVGQTTQLVELRYRAHCGATGRQPASGCGLSANVGTLPSCSSCKPATTLWSR